MNEFQQLMTRIGLAVVAGVFVLWWLVNTTYIVKRNDLQSSIDRQNSVYGVWLKESEANRKQVAQLREFESKSIAINEQDAEHVLRTRLNDIGAKVGLSEIRVNTQRMSAELSPAKVYLNYLKIPKNVRDQPDWYVLPGDINGIGTLDQIVRTVEAINAEPYLKRVDSVAIVPRKGDQFQLTVKIEALLLPNAKPAPWPDPVVPATSAYASMIAKNVFRVPPPEPEPIKVAQADPPQNHEPPPPPWHEWTITGIVRLDNQPEVWLRNLKTDETLHLRQGQEILKARIEQIETDDAVISIDGKKFMVEIGRTLQDRKPVAQ